MNAGSSRSGVVRVVCALAVVGSCAVTLSAAALSSARISTGHGRTPAANAITTGAGKPGRNTARLAASATAPTALLQGPGAPGRPLRGQVIRLTAFAAAASGRTITEVDFQISPAGLNQWQTFATSIVAPYSATLDSTDTTYVPQNGPYDFRAIATDSAGEQGVSAVVQNRVVANGASYVALAPTGTPLRGTVKLTATPEVGGSVPDTVTFETCPVATNCLANPSQWTTLATVQQQLNGSRPTPDVTTLDTTGLADGSYDLSVTAGDASGDAFVGGVVGDVLVDNTPTTTTLANPGGSLSGVVTLTASAQDTGSGVASVKFESSPAGADTWTTIGVATSAPYTTSFDTQQLANGSYDLRVEATDNAGNTAASPVVAGVEVSNLASENFADLTLTNYIAPATNIHLLGEIAGSPNHETWALGETNAPPPTIDGAPLPYTAQGDGQWVLLRYTDDTGWEIVDVLRNQDGSPYQLDPTQPAVVSGQMTGSGEAWITLTQGNQAAVFHRLPGGPFELDPATKTLSPLLLGGAAQVRLGQTANGTTYGIIVPSSQPLPFQSGTAPSPIGPVQVSAGLEFGELFNGSNFNGQSCVDWCVQDAPLPADYTAPSGGDTIALKAADPTGPGTGWAALQSANTPTMILARYDQNGWHFLASTGLDALDDTDEFAASSQQSASNGGIIAVTPTAIRADSSGVWVSATLNAGGPSGQLVARYDTSSGQVVDSWCTSLPRQSLECAQPLDPSHPAEVPDAVFDTPQGEVADALSTTANTVDVYAHGTWTSVTAPGFGGFNGGEALFVDPTDGWLVGTNALAQVSAGPPPSQLASWPEANRNPLLSVALPPGQSTTATPGALAVGLNGTALHYDASAGWQVNPTPPRAHHIELYGVAFAGSSSAFAVGQEGTILRWDGSSWSEDPQSVSLTTATLNAVAFGADGQGWAVGSNGTILHYDGTAWSTEQIDAADANRNITSVAVAGQDVFAIVGGNLITRSPDGTWQQVNPALLPSPAPPLGSLKLVSGLPDGGLVVAGKSLLMVRESSSASLEYAPESFQGIPVALAAFRDPSGSVRAFVSVAPPIQTVAGLLTDDVGGFPSGDGDLILQTGSGWDDLSRAQYPAESSSAKGDGVVQPDPVLAVAASPDGSHAWAVGGYSGTHAADGIGTDNILSARPSGWLASAIWRYDAGGSVQSVAVTPAQPSLPATAGTVSFAFFSSALCKIQCAAVQNAQPDVNLRTAAGQIAAFAQQPGGPAFAMLGGNALGPNAADLASLPGLLSPLGSLPTYAAYGPLDAVPTQSDPLAWADAFADAPAPFGPGAAPAAITPAGSGDPTGPVNKYYAFNVSQNGGTLRAIVLDNSAGSLEASAPGQTAWLSNELTAAQAAGLPVVVFAAEPLNTGTNADAVAAQLAAAGVLAVFTTSGGAAGSRQAQQDQVAHVPADAAPGAPQIPEYEGATLTYQQPNNNGVLWYDVSVDTAARKVTVKAIPVISSLALEPLDGLSVARSSTLSFQAIGRRPPGTIATTPEDPTFPGYAQYVGIPSSTCSGCIGPSYSFTSSDPVVGDFVVASAPGSPYPKLSASGATTHSSTSGLFCAFNSGTTTISVTSGLMSASLPVTVAAGGFGPPCGTVPGGTRTDIITVPGRTLTEPGSNPGTGSPVPPTGQPSSPFVQPKISIPPPPHAVVVPAPTPTPAPAPKPSKPPSKPVVHTPPQVLASTSTPVQPALVGIPPVVLPLIPPALTPVPPGGATVSAQAAARREEKARKHARQSAFVTRPAGTSGDDWFYPAAGVVGVLALLLSAGGLRAGPRPKLALLELSQPLDTSRRRGRRP